MNQKKRRKALFKGVFSNYDIRIIIVFLILLIIGGLFWLYQRKDYVDCEDANFYVIAERFATEEVITFNNQTYNAKSWEWDFGDGSPKSYNQQVLHKYNKEGIYTVKLVINGSCEIEQQVEIRYLGKLLDQNKIPDILAPRVVSVNEPVHFDYKYKGEAFSWEWSFGESGRMDNTQPRPTYIYQTVGTKSVTLIINSDVKHIATQDIHVKPREIVTRKFEDPLEGYTPEKEPEVFVLPPGEPQIDPMEEFIETIPLKLKEKAPKKDSIIPLELAPDVSEDQFELLLMQVANQSKTKEDFSKYICGDYEIPVIKNGKNPIPFSEFCKQLKGKEIKINTLRLTKDNLNCVDGFSIEYKTKKFPFWVKE